MQEFKAFTWQWYLTVILGAFIGTILYRFVADFLICR